MISELEKLRLKGQVEDYLEFDEEEESQDNSLALAIGDLSERIKDMGTVSVDLSPVMSLLAEVVDIQKRMMVKRKWKFDVVQDKSGDLQSILATEL